MGPGSVSNTGLGTLWHGEPGWELILRDTWCISALWTARVWGKNGSIKTYQDREAFTKNARQTNLTRRRVHHSLPLVFADLSGMLAHLWRKKTYTYFGVFHITSYKSKGQFPRTSYQSKGQQHNCLVLYSISLLFTDENTFSQVRNIKVIANKQRKKKKFQVHTEQKSNRMVVFTSRNVTPPVTTGGAEETHRLLTQHICKKDLQYLMRAVHWGWEKHWKPARHSERNNKSSAQRKKKRARQTRPRILPKEALLNLSHG